MHRLSDLTLFTSGLVLMFISLFLLEVWFIPLTGGSKMSDYDLCAAIEAYEEGTMEEEDVRDFFQALVNSGLAWTLQGAYGRKAHAMLDAGEIDMPEEGPLR